MHCNPFVTYTFTIKYPVTRYAIARRSRTKPAATIVISFVGKKECEPRY